MAKGIKPDQLSGAARFLGGGQSMDRVEFRGLTGRLDTNRIAELHTPAARAAVHVPRPLEKVKREFVLTRETDAVISEVVSVLRETTTARLSSSHVLRGLARLLMRRLPALRSAAVASGPRRLPSTSHEHLHARIDFEQFLAEVFELALGSQPATGVQAGAIQAMPSQAGATQQGTTRDRTVQDGTSQSETAQAGTTQAEPNDNKPAS